MFCTIWRVENITSEFGSKNVLLWLCKKKNTSIGTEREYIRPHQTVAHNNTHIHT